MSDLLIFKIKRRLMRYLMVVFQLIRVFKYRFLSDCLRVNGVPIRNQPVLLTGRGIICFDSKIKLGLWPSPFYYNGYIHIEARNPSAIIHIGDGTHINNNCVLVSEHKGIRIGKHVLIGTSVEIIDSNFHNLDPAKRMRSDPEYSGEVVIGDNVLIGSNSRIIKGVVIGENSVIANSSIVVSDIPANVIAGGNPAKVLKQL